MLLMDFMSVSIIPFLRRMRRLPSVLLLRGLFIGYWGEFVVIFTQLLSIPSQRQAL